MADYRLKTACNCLGALVLAQGIYGVPIAATLRVWDTLLGVVLACAIMFVFHRISSEGSGSEAPLQSA